MKGIGFANAFFICTCVLPLSTEGFATGIYFMPARKN